MLISSDEYVIASKILNYSNQQVFDLSYRCINSTFASEVEKEILRVKWRQFAKENGLDCD